MTMAPSLLEVFLRLPTPSASELLQALGVSRATLARVVAEAGPEIVRMGRARATRYARSREVAGLGRSAPLFEVGPLGEVTSDGVLRFLAGGRQFWDHAAGGELFEGLPPFLADMAPQGYLGRSFAARHAELGLPVRLSDWSDDHRLLSLARRGEDAVGNRIVGEESLNRFLAAVPIPHERRDFPALARAAEQGEVGSSAGGERPKFGTFSRGRHVLVKFAGGEGASARRWRDLLWCEWQAGKTLAEAGFPVAHAEWFDEGDFRFLEVERFDRLGERGRRAVLSLAAIDDEYFGQRDSWSRAAVRLLEAGWIREGDARAIRWWDTFGQLTGNTDRHFGNLSLFPAAQGRLELAPAYDMLPMILAPAATGPTERPFTPEPPTAQSFDLWAEVAPLAIRYWETLAAQAELGEAVRRSSDSASHAVKRIAARVGGVAFP